MLSNIICLFIKITDPIMHMGNGDVPVIFVRWEESRLEKVVSTNNLACGLSEACNLPMYFYVWQAMWGGGIWNFLYTWTNLLRIFWSPAVLN